MSFREDIQGWYKNQLLIITDHCFELGVIDDIKDLLNTFNKNADAMMHAEVVNTLLKNEEAIAPHLDAIGVVRTMNIVKPIEDLMRMHRLLAYMVVDFIDKSGIELP